jgi:hypothetical protein
MAIALLLVPSGCGGGGGGTSGALTGGGQTIAQPGWTVDRATGVQPSRKWTVLVYLDAANDLEAFGTLNVNQMELVGSNGNVNVVVQFKRIKGAYDTSDGDWGGTRRYYVAQDRDSGHVSSPILSHRDGLNMGDPQTLQDFVQWGVATFPAQRYCLVLWNHGAGWRAEAAGYKLGKIVYTGRGVAYDDEFQTNGYSAHIDTIQLPAAMSLGNGRKWDLLAFDASLMQMAEVSYQVRDQATWIVGSEESPPGTGYPYDQILFRLVSTPDMDGKALGILFAQQMLASNSSGSNITQSVLDTSKLVTIAPAVDALGTALSAAQGNYGAAISNARAASESYAYPENHDLLDFTRALATSDPKTGQTVTADPGVSAAVGQVQGAVQAALAFNTHGDQHPRSNGLAIFLPTPTDYALIDAEQANGFGQRYSTLSLAQAAPNWMNFLVNGPR